MLIKNIKEHFNANIQNSRIKNIKQKWFSTKTPFYSVKIELPNLDKTKLLY